MTMGLLQNLQLRMDPWSVDFGTGFAASEDAEEILNRKVNVDCSVELPESRWKPVTSELDMTDDGPTIFMDGVRRMEMRLVQERDAVFLFGGVGSLAAGAVTLQHGRMNSMPNSLKLCEVRRLLFLPGLQDTTDIIDIPLSYPQGKHLSLEVIPIAGMDPSEPLSGLQQEMRKTEATVAERMASLCKEEDLIIADGPLNLPLFLGSVVGYIKTLQALYVPSNLYSTLLKLQEGERTPMFLIRPEVEMEDSMERYSCYLRMGESVDRYASLSGVVRLEVSAHNGADQARAIMNRCALQLPQFASPFGRDPRAPQNLMPLSALERELRRRMGNTALIRGILEDQL